MSHVLAEGGYQAFDLSGTDTTVLLVSLLVALGALGVAFVMMQGVLKADVGGKEMTDISDAIHEGAMAYIKRQFRTIAVIVVPLAIVVFLTSTKIEKDGGEVALSFVQSGLFRTLAFLVGAVSSASIGFLGMWLATKANVRTTAAAVRSDFGAAFAVAFRTGGVVGLATAGLGLAGATVIILLFQNTSTAMLVGFGFGGSLLALFLRVGGGIFTKAADVGADLVGKVEAGIPEDDPRNPATIADNVGDNVGDCAGMAADLFESYEVTLVASIILGVAAFKSIFPDDPSKWVLGLMFPLAARAIGVVGSIVGIFFVKAKEGETNALKPINKGFFVAGSLTLLGTLLVALVYVGNDSDSVGWKCFGAVAIGLVLAQLISRLTEFYTATHHSPVKEIAQAAETGPATAILAGTASGMESAVYAVVAIAIAIAVSLMLGGGNLQFSFYLVALTGMGMLATTGIIVSEDTFGPVSDNAAGIAEMSGEFHGEAERIMVSLDAVGNTTKAVTKGFAIGSAVIAAVALFASFIETAAQETLKKVEIDELLKGARGVFDKIPINVADPKIFIGLLIGGAVPFLFSALAIRAVGRTAGVVVQEVRKQFADGKIMSGEKEPEYGPVIDICTEASLRELATPALLAVLTPVVIGFGVSFLALGAFLAAVILVGQLMANYLSNAGGSWDNAKKYIEDGNHGGKGSDPYRAAVIADTVGDPFKDTAGPALNPLIKVMNLVSLLILPAIIGLKDNDGARFSIAAAALVVLIGALTFSARQKTSLGADTTPAAAVPVPAQH